MNRVVWIGSAFGLVIAIAGRGAVRYLGTVLITIMALVACAGCGVAAVRSFSASGPSAKAFLQAGRCLLATAAVVWILVLPLVPFDTWFVGKADPRIRAALVQRAVATADLKDMDPAFLASLDSSLGASRIVGLGESYHWTSEYTIAKTSIIRHLHEHDGFDVLLFESSIAPLFFACEDMVREGEARRGVEGLFYCWQTEEMEELFTYILSTQATERPLRVYGIDRQHFKSDFTDANRLMQEAATLVGLESDEDDPERAAWTGILERRRRRDADDPAVAGGAAYYRGLAGAFRAAAGTGGRSSDESLKLTIAAMVAEGLAEDLRGQTLSGRERYIARDRFMAQRVREFRETVVPDRKLIVWAHDAHLWMRPEEHRLARCDLLGNLEYWLKYGRTPIDPNLGRIVKDRYGPEFFTIGFFGSSGRVGTFLRNDWRFVRGRRPDSLEEVLRPRTCRRTGAAVYCSLRDLADEAAAVELKILSNRIQWRSVRPARQFDAVVVIDRLHPQHFLGK